MAKPTVRVSSQTIATSATVSTSNTNPGSRARATGNKKAGTNVKPLSTQERMSMFMEHTVASSYKSTPKIVIRKDTNFKSACNKIRWLNKGSEAAAARTMKSSSASNSKDSTSSNEEKVNDDNGSQFYSFHEKADPSLDESVNPPIKLPSALLVRIKCVCMRIFRNKNKMSRDFWFITTFFYSTCMYIIIYIYILELYCVFAQTGHRSVDASIQNVRSQMDKV